MKKLLAIMLLNATFMYGMEKGNEEKTPGFELSEQTMRELYIMAYESGSATINDLAEKLFTTLRSQSAFHPPLEIILKIINSIQFSSPLELLRFLIVFSSVNRHNYGTLKPLIANIMFDKTKISAESINEFLELVANRRNIPSDYMEKLLIDHKNRKHIKLLAQLKPDDLGKALRALLPKGEKALLPYTSSSKYFTSQNDHKEIMDIIMATPTDLRSQSIYTNYDLLLYTYDRLFQFSVRTNNIKLLKMLLGTKNSLNVVCANSQFQIRSREKDWFDNENFATTFVGVVMNGPSYVFEKLYAVKPLAYALYSIRNLEIAKLLLEAGANPNSKTRSGKSLLDIAIELDDKDSEKLLLKYKAK